MEFNPTVGVGVLYFGQSRAEVRKHLNEPYEVIVHRLSADFKREVDAYADLKLTTYFDPNDQLEAVEFYDQQLSHRGTHLPLLSYRKTLEHFKLWDPNVEFDSNGAIFKTLGLVIQEPETVEHVPNNILVCALAYLEKTDMPSIEEMMDHFDVDPPKWD